MGLKYVSAYLLAVLGGKEDPTVEDVEAILRSIDVSNGGGGHVDVAELMAVISAIKKEVARSGKPVHEVIACGREKLEIFGGPVAAADAAADDPGKEKGIVIDDNGNGVAVDDPDVDDDVDWDLF